MKVGGSNESIPYGEAATFDCMGFGKGEGDANGVAAPNLLYAAMENFFVVIDMRYGQIAVFNRTGDGSSFVNTSNRMLLPTNMPENWYDLFHNGVVSYNLNRVQPLGLSAGVNSFVITAASTTGSFERLEWRWNGKNWVASRDALSTTPDGRGYETVWPSMDGHIIVGEKGLISRYRHKSADDRGYQKLEVSGNLNGEANSSPRIGSTANFVAAQFHTAPPPWKENSEYPMAMSWDYADADKVWSYVFRRSEGSESSENAQVFLDDLSQEARPSNICPTGLYDLRISMDERNVVAKCQYKWKNGQKIACGVLDARSQVCHIDLFQIPFVESDGITRKIQSAAKWKLLDSYEMRQVYTPTLKISRGNGIVMYTWGRPDSAYVRFAPTFEEGVVPTDSISPTLDGSVVSKIIRRSLYTPSAPRIAKVSSGIEFHYSRNRDSLSYDGGSLSLESRYTKVYRFAGDFLDTLGKEEYEHWGTSYPEGHFSPVRPELVGELKSKRITSRDGEMTASEYLQTVVKNGSGWSRAVSLVRDSIAEFQQTAQQGARRQSTTATGRTDPHALLPRVQMSLLPDNGAVDDLVNLEYRHAVTVNSYNDHGRIIQSRSLLYSTREQARRLLDATLTPSLEDATDQDIASGHSIAIGGSKATYLANNIDRQERYNWGYGTDPGSSPQWAAGQVSGPISFFAGWRKTDSVGLRNAYGQPLQMISVVDPTHPISSMNVIEGLRGQVTATLTPAWPEEIAVMTAEDGQVGLNGNTSKVFDQSKWYIPSGVSFDKTLSHLGRYSLKIDGAAGPLGRVRLYDRETLKQGLEISAWVYAPEGTSPIMTTLIRWNPTSGLNTVQTTQNPVGNTILSGTWQRWSKRFSYSELRSMGVLNSKDGVVDFAASISAQSGQTIWVDNFVIRPVSSSLSLVSYDHQGRGIGSMDENGHWMTTEYDLRGRVQAVRDERGRIVGQNAFYPAGDN